MIAEIICVGSELLLGETVNTNAPYISGKLSSLGINCFYQTTVGDNPERIQAVLDIALKRAELLIFTGGLGPTDDDLTVQAIADYFGKEMIFDEQSYKDIQNFFIRLKRDMPISNKKQAYRPEGAGSIPNPAGTAPGILWEIDNKIIMCFPGVPDELYKMWEETAHPYLEKFSQGVLLTRHLKYFGIAEAALADMVRDLMDKPNPTVAPLVGRGESRLRIAAKADTNEEALNLIQSMQDEILSRTKEWFYGIDNQTLEEVVSELLKEKKLTVAVAESCTGGLVSSRLTDISGSSKFIKANFVTYSNEAKVKFLGVNEKLIENYGAVSDKTAISMAEGVKSFVHCDIGLSLTGIAGPTGGSESKPVGLVYIGLCDKFRLEVHKVLVSPNLSRKEIKFRFSQYALNYLRLFLENNSLMSGKSV